MFKKNLIFLSLAVLINSETPNEEILQSIIHADLSTFKEVLKKHPPKAAEKELIERHITDNLLDNVLEIEEEISLIKMNRFLSEYEHLVDIEDFQQKQPQPPSFEKNTLLEKIKSEFNLTEYSNMEETLSIGLLENPTRIKDYIKNPIIKMVLENFSAETKIHLELTQKRSKYLEDNYVNSSSFATKLFSYSSKINLLSENSKIETEINSSKFKMDCISEKHIEVFKDTLNHIFSMIMLVDEAEAFSVFKELEKTGKSPNKLGLDITKTSKQIQNTTDLYSIIIKETPEMKELVANFDGLYEKFPYIQKKNTREIRCRLKKETNVVSLLTEDNWNIHNCEKIFINNKETTPEDIENSLFKR